MTKVTLPRTNQTGANEWSDVEANDNALAEVINGQLDNENIKAGAGITREKLAADAKGIVGAWYTPKVIATEETRTNTAFGTLTTADEITGVVVPENGLLVVAYQALFKSSSGNAGKAAVFIGGEQLKRVAAEGAPQVQEASTSTNGLVANRWVGLASTVNGLNGRAENSDVALGVSTGLIIGTNSGSLTTADSGPIVIGSIAAGTYAISVKYKATSGSVTAKERKLWVYVLGG